MYQAKWCISICNPSIWEIETGGTGVQGQPPSACKFQVQPGLHKILCPKESKIHNNKHQLFTKFNCFAYILAFNSMKCKRDNHILSSTDFNSLKWWAENNKNYDFDITKTHKMTHFAGWNFVCRYLDCCHLSWYKTYSSNPMWLQFSFLSSLQQVWAERLWSKTL